MAYARNDKLFADGADQAQLAKQVRYVIGGSDEVAKTFRVIALPKSWVNDPWTALDEAEQPDKWDDRLPILVLPGGRQARRHAGPLAQRPVAKSVAIQCASCYRARAVPTPSRIVTCSSSPAPK